MRPIGDWSLRGDKGAATSIIFNAELQTAIRKTGTGLGLWVTHDIVRQHGGMIEVTSGQNRLTTFNVTLLVDSPTLAGAGNGQPMRQEMVSST